MIYESNEGKKLCKRNHDSLIIIGQKRGWGRMWLLYASETPGRNKYLETCISIFFSCPSM